MSTLTGIDLTATPANIIVASNSNQWVSVPMTGAVTISSGGITSLTTSSTYNFSAFITSVTVSSNTQFGNWQTTTPFFTGPGFNATSGSYTIQATGKYFISVTMNYFISAVGVGIGGSVNPAIAVTRTLPSALNLLAGALPILNITLIRCLLGSGQVNLSGIAQLTAGDTIGVVYQASGGTTSIPIGAATTPGLTWSVQSLF